MKAFTLSEVLITFGIIGIVAAMTLPTIITNLKERSNSERQANVAQKVTRAMDRMRANGALNETYPSTESFVDEFQKYIKITKRCDSDHIKDCWPSEKVTLEDGSQLDIKTVQLGRNLSLPTSTNNVGIVLSDGASLILNYNPNSKNIDVGDRVKAYRKELPVGGGKTKNFPYSSNVTDSIDFIMDVNGMSKPNRQSGPSNEQQYDVRAFNLATLNKCAGFSIPGIECVVDIKTGYNGSEICYLSSTREYICTLDDNGKQQCNFTHQKICYNSYWQGAKEKCESMGLRLPSRSELQSINSQYGILEGIPYEGTYWTNDSSECLVDYHGGGVYTCHKIYNFTLPNQIKSTNPNDMHDRFAQNNVMCISE